MSVSAMKAGAVEFLVKPFQNDELLAAVRQAVDRDRKARQQRTDLADLRKRYNSLTAREREVLALYHFEELTMKEVGVVMGIGESRVSQIRTTAVIRLRARLQQWFAKSPRNDSGSRSSLSSTQTPKRN